MVKEIERREFKHDSPLHDSPYWNGEKIVISKMKSCIDLVNKCKECRTNILINNWEKVWRE